MSSARRANPYKRVDCRPLLGRQQSGGQKERPPVFGVQCPAAPVGLTQQRIAHTGGVEFGTDHFRTARGAAGRRTTPVTRSAASRPDSNAVGTPTPGTVEDPASTTLQMPRTVLAGLNGPV